MGKIELANRSNCTGCSACSDVCPKNCITFKAENALQRFPFINESICIECGLCAQTCPQLVPLEIKKDISPKCYAVWNNDNNDRLASTSGGFGASVATWALKNEYYVCGAMFDNDWNLIHKISNDSIEIKQFRQSKYLQSSTEGIFKEVKRYLSAGEKILFIGTPCQVAGLLKVCSNKYKDSLITIDIICHGVNSPIVWKDYVLYLQQTHNSILTKYNFRDKSHGWEKKNGSPNLRVSMEFENGLVINKKSIFNLFHYWFGQHYMLNETCFDCLYRNLNRISDITIGDFWGIQNLIPSADINKGVSAIIVNSQQGQNILDCCDVTSVEVDFNKASAYLRGLVERRSPEYRKNEIRKMKEFTDFYLKMPFKEVSKKYSSPTQLSFFIERVKNLFHIK